jgi:hypothetical protein
MVGKRIRTPSGQAIKSCIWGLHHNIPDLQGGKVISTQVLALIAYGIQARNVDAGPRGFWGTVVTYILSYDCTRCRERSSVQFSMGIQAGELAVLGSMGVIPMGKT